MKTRHTKSKLISFGILSYKNSYPFIVSVFYILKNLAYTEIKDKYATSQWKNNPLFFVFLFFIGQSLNGIIYFISYYLINKKRETRNIQEEELNNCLIKVTVFKFGLIVNTINQNKTFLFYYLTTILSVIVISSINILTSQNDSSRDLSYEMRLFNLFFIAVLSYFMLKYPIHRHQWFSFLFVSIGLLLCFCFRFIYNTNILNEDILTYIPIYLVVYFGYAIRDVLEKWIMEKENQLPSKLIFYQGLFGLGTMLIIMPINDIFDSKATPFYTLIVKMFFDISLGYIFIGYILSCMAYTFFSIYTKYHFSPTALPISYSFAMIIWKFIHFQNLKTEQTVCMLIGYALILFGCLIYNEIVILYCCGLQINTKKEITIRSQVELSVHHYFDYEINGNNDDFVY